MNLDKQNKFQLPSPVEKVQWPSTFRKEFDDRGLELFVKRDDLIHPEVSGNKWRKLKYNIAQAQQTQKAGVVTFGGAYSNHLLATAAACHEFGLKSFGLVRGEELNANSNLILNRCNELGTTFNLLNEVSMRLEMTLII